MLGLLASKQSLVFHELPEAHLYFLNVVLINVDPEPVH